MRQIVLHLIACLLILPTNLGMAQPANFNLPLVNAELFGIDRSHSYLSFAVRFLGMSTVKGSFNNYDAAILYDEEDMTKTSVTVVLDVSSIDTANDWRDEDLRSERFFDAKTHPYIVFQSQRIEKAADGYIMHGRLTMRGVTKEIAVPFQQTLRRTVDSGWGNIRIGFEGRFTIDRTEYGIHGGEFWGLEALSDEVGIEFGLLGNIFNMEKIAFSSREKTSIGEVLQQVITESGVEAGVKKYHELRNQRAEDYNFDESQLNRLGYKLLQNGKIEEAVKVLRLNAEAYPGSANVYDSLGYAYVALGDQTRAAESFAKALALNPYIPSAMELTRRLSSVDG